MKEDKPNITELVAEIRKIADENQDFIFTDQCVYTEFRDDDWHGACIVGVAMERLGHTVSPSGTGNFARFRELAHGLVAVEGNYSAVKWVDRVQIEQDARKSWGDAVETANKLFPEV